MRAMLHRLVVVCVCAAGTASAQGIVALGWLAGCWAPVGGEAGSGEQWMAPARGTLYGVSRTLRGGRVVAHEFMRITDSDGGPWFIALPSDQTEGRFKLVEQGERRVVFENPAHDFPQRVVYESPDEATLNAHIEGRRSADAPLRRIEFPMRRQPCSPASR
jgi:Domain of unknown function (DUF6265)